MLIYKHVPVSQNVSTQLLLIIQHASVFQFAPVHLLCSPTFKVWNVLHYAILAIILLIQQGNVCKTARCKDTIDKIHLAHVLKVVMLLKRPTLII